jgi:multisubunit Na+/H+ antiporter MnhG subunit
MKSGNGSQELTRLATAYFASIAFAVTFLVGSLSGVDGGTALLRSVTAAAIAIVVGYLLAAPVVDVVLAAMARDEAARQAAERAKEDDS